jgi:LCP family protein required for cell wall assembly
MPTQIDKEEITKLNKAQPEQKHTFQKVFNRILTGVIISVLIFLSYFLFTIVSTSGQVFVNPEDSTCSNWFCNVRNGLIQIPQIFGGDAKLKGQSRDRTNILILGVDATGEKGLSDTIIIASIFHKEKKITTSNIPRDSLVEYNGTRFKVNEIYGTAEANRPGSGPGELSNFLSRELGIDIPYWALTNFDGAEQAVDMVGGVDIDVENAFTDCEFPNKSFGYLACQSFTKGPQFMSGKTALIYARSRHGDNGEGSDFARSRRQSIVVQAMLQKIKSQNAFQSISKFSEISSLLGKNVKTNINLAEMKSIVNFARSIDLKSDFLRVNWAIGNGFLCDITNSQYGYYIYYCPDTATNFTEELNFNGQIMGTRPLIPTKSKYKAQQSIQNILIKAQGDKLTNLEIVILGNGAKSAQKIYNTITDATAIPVLTNVTINNFYTKIPVTPTPEKITVYILDPSLNESIKERLNDIGNFANPIQYTIKNALDDKIVLPKANQSAKVIFWLE